MQGTPDAFQLFKGTSAFLSEDLNLIRTSVSEAHEALSTDKKRVRKRVIRRGR